MTAKLVQTKEKKIMITYWTSDLIQGDDNDFTVTHYRDGDFLHPPTFGYENDEWRRINIREERNSRIDTSIRTVCR